MIQQSPTERACELARRIVAEFRPAGWPAKENEIARLLERTYATQAAQPAEADGVGRLRMFLEILSAAGGIQDATEGRWNWINAFCSEHEGREPDTFNTANQRGFTTVSHDTDTDSGVVRLTEAGKAWLAATPPAPNDDLRAALIAELEPLIAKVAEPNGWDWMFPLREVPVDGKPTIVSHKGGNLFRGYIGTWDEARLLIALANAAPRIIAALKENRRG